MEITFVTGNQQKFEEASLILSDFSLKQAKIDLPEIQGDRFDVTREKARLALEKVQAPLFVEDVSICCDALNGLPGPFIKFFLKSIGDSGLADLISRYSNSKAQAIATIGYIEPGMSEPHLVEGVLEGKIVLPRGELKHGTYSWNAIFQPDGFETTMAEISMEEHAEISHRRKAMIALKEFCLERT